MERFRLEVGHRHGVKPGHIVGAIANETDLVGREMLAGDTGAIYTDVWSHDGYAYIGTFKKPCTDAGVLIVDISAAIANYPGTEGATVATIKSAPNTRINDVKVHTVGDTDVLITTQEPCGMDVPAAAQAGNNPPGQIGQGGISLYDVTDPTKPKALKKNFLEFGGVHNTFPWTYDGKSYLIATANTFDFFDTFFVDISKPQSPRARRISAIQCASESSVTTDLFHTASCSSAFESARLRPSWSAT